MRTYNDSTENLAAGTENGAVLALAQLAAERAESIEAGTNGVHSFVLQTGERQVVESFEKFAASPHRQRGTTKVIDIGSFVNMVNRVSDPDTTVLFADEDSGSVTAVVNYDEGWGDHRVVLDLQAAPEWEHWRDADSKLMRQVAFAEHIEDGLSSIVSPPAADLMELAQTFQAKRELQFESGTRLQSGDVKFRYHEETKAGAGQAGDLEVPEVFQLSLPVYRGGASFPITARLRYRITSEGLALGYKLDRPDELVQAAFQENVTSTAEALASFLVVSGPAPAAVAPQSATVQHQ